MMMKFEEKHEGSGSLVGENQPYLGEKHQVNCKPVANGKAEASVKQEEDGNCDKLRKSLNTYSWQEIQRHNQKSDQWLVINCKVYDVTAWADRHPGGRRVLNHYAGEDATVRNSELRPVYVRATGWLGPWLSSQKYCRDMFKLHNNSSPTKFSGFLFSKNLKANYAPKSSYDLHQVWDKVSY